MPYYIYFVRDSRSQLVKIGRTGQLDDRVMRLQNGGRTPARLEAAFPTMNSRDEQLMHWFMRDYHSHGEWFKCDRWDVSEAVEAWLTRYAEIVQEYQEARRNGFRLKNHKKGEELMESEKITEAELLAIEELEPKIAPESSSSFMERKR